MIFPAVGCGAIVRTGIGVENEGLTGSATIGADTLELIEDPAPWPATVTRTLRYVPPEIGAGALAETSAVPSLNKVLESICTALLSELHRKRSVELSTV